MGRDQSTGSNVNYVIVKDVNDGNQSRFIMGDPAKEYATLSGKVTSISTRRKEIIPKTGSNAGKTITIHELSVGLEDSEGEMILQFDLYSSTGRDVLNALAGVDELGEVYFSVYKNKNGIRSISIKKSKEKNDYYTPYYAFDVIRGMVGTKVVKGEKVKDYDALSDRFITELLPIIQGKINASDIPNDPEFSEATQVNDAPKKYDENDDLPF